MIRIPTTAWRARGKTLALALVLAASLAVFVAAGRAAAVPVAFTVTNTNDSGAGSLRQAIIDANSNLNPVDTDTISFAIPATDPNCDAATGVCTISPTSELPEITETVTIDGYSQPGASPNTLATGNNARLKIELNGASVEGFVEGLMIRASNSTVKGLIINRWNGAGVEIRISGWDASGNRIEGNYIGTDASGTQDLGNSYHGVYIAGSGDNVVGGTSAAARNLISGNQYSGVAVSGDGNRIEGNYIGTDASGTQDLGNSRGGVLIEEFSDNVVGGTSVAARNLISGNTFGVVISGPETTGNRIEGNYIGTDASGTQNLGNGRGVVIAAPGNVVGGTSAAARNLISGNTVQGIEVSGSETIGNRILRNSIFDNGNLGIDLLGPGNVTPNDPGDADTGGNNLQNFPVVTSATTDSGSTTVQGGLNSTPNDTFSLQFFSSPAADPSGFGEGETFVGQANVTTNAGGTVAFEFTTSTPVAGGRVITATATSISTDDTSEFSRATEVEANTPPPARCSDGLDNDSDGQTDFPADTNCSSATDDSEAPDPPAGCTIVGTPGEDNLVGTSGGDTICGLGGRDTISADAGNDTVRGGPGGDTILGRSGSDTLQGGDGADAVRGGAGDDDLSGEVGPDGLYGEAGDDALDARDGVRGNDTSNGGSGIDTCSSDVGDGEERCET